MPDDNTPANSSTVTRETCRECHRPVAPGEGWTLTGRDTICQNCWEAYAVQTCSECHCTIDPGDGWTFTRETLCQNCWESYADGTWWKMARSLPVPQSVRNRKLTIEVFSWLATIIAVAGVILNNRQSPWCFAVWLVSNSLTAGIHLRSRLWALTVRDLIFLALAVEGWWRWTH